MGKYTNYKFPSNAKVEFDPSEIEPSLRRVSSKKTNWLFWLLMGVLLATVLHFTIEPLLTPQAHADTIQNPLCEQYLHDSALNGTAAQETLNKICN